MTSWSGAGGASRATCSARVSPVQVMAVPSRKPASSSSLTITCSPPDRVHVHHGVLAEGPHVDEDGQPASGRVELLLAHGLRPEIDAGGAGDLDTVQDDVGGAAHGDGDRHRVAQRGRRRRCHWGEYPVHCQGEEAVDQLLGEIAEATGVVRCRRHHVQRFEAEHRNERLHGVVGEHAAAAALPGAGVQGVAGPHLLGLIRHLEGGHEVDGLAGLGVDPGMDGAVRQDHGRRVVLEHGGQGPNGGLVAGHHGDEPGDGVGGQVHVGHIVDELAPDQGEAHLWRPVELPVRHPEGEGWRDQPEPEPVCGDTPVQCRLHRLHLGADAEIALAVAQVADDGPDRVVDLLDVLTQEVGRADPLHVAARGSGRRASVFRLTSYGRTAYGSSRIPLGGMQRSISRHTQRFTRSSSAMIDGDQVGRGVTGSSPAPPRRHSW